MQQNWQGFRGDGRGRKGFWTVAVVCLALMALLTAVQLTHLHTSATDADHCALCIAMHSAAPVAATAALVVLVRMKERVAVAEARATSRRRFSRLVSRGPPGSC